MQDIDTPETTDVIRQRAYAIWESEGRPDGCAEQHWAQAKAEMSRAGDSARAAPAPARKSRKA